MHEEVECEEEENNPMGAGYEAKEESIGKHAWCSLEVEKHMILLLFLGKEE